MKNRVPFVALALLICAAASFIGFSPARAINIGNHVTSNTNFATLHQAKLQPFCKYTYVDHHGRSIKLHTNTVHATAKSMTFIFDSGEILVFNFTIIRPGHFVASSARSKDPQIIFYPSHNSHAVPMIGAVVISSVKPINGNFSHLLSDDDDHITLVSGVFSF